MTRTRFDAEITRIVAAYHTTQPRGPIVPETARQAVESMQLAAAALAHLTDVYEMENKR